MKIVDLRSDTVTLPTEEMRDAIRNAELGDDVFEEDPTTLALQEKAARITGKEAALLVPSGTMGNLVCTLTHCARGEEAIVGDRCHIFLYEAGGMAALGGVQPRTVPNKPDGTMSLEDISRAVRIEDEHQPRTRLICLENTHNSCQGYPLAPEYIDAVASLAQEHGLRVHLDGSRIFNAAVALDVPVAELAREVDSLTFCLSKGLACPVGSVVCGSGAFISEARRTRKVLGGGLRQSGIIAAAGLAALDTMVARLREDHANAHTLARGISRIPGFSIDVSMIRTNIVYFDLEESAGHPDTLLHECGERGLRFLQTAPRSFRMVTHHGIEEDDIQRCLAILEEVMSSPAAS